MTEPFKIAVNVLGYREDGQWCALALEMDIRGYGDTWKEASKNLMELVEMQISFAVQSDQMDLVYRPADAVWFQRFAELRAQEFASINGNQDDQYRIAGIPISPAHIITEQNAKFRQA